MYGEKTMEIDDSYMDALLEEQNKATNKGFKYTIVFKNGTKHEFNSGNGTIGTQEGLIALRDAVSAYQRYGLLPDSFGPSNVGPDYYTFSGSNFSLPYVWLTIDIREVIAVFQETL
jgi:hypothetical protein